MRKISIPGDFRAYIRPNSLNPAVPHAQDTRAHGGLDTRRSISWYDLRLQQARDRTTRTVPRAAAPRHGPEVAHTQRHAADRSTPSGACKDTAEQPPVRSEIFLGSATASGRHLPGTIYISTTRHQQLATRTSASSPDGDISAMQSTSTRAAGTPASTNRLH